MSPAASVSVLLPCYNSANHLASAVESVLENTQVEFEIVLVDDGSTDESGAIAEKFATRDARVRLIKRRHEGLVPSLNRGLYECRGEFIARMDADDICFPIRLQRQYDTMLSDSGLALTSCLVEPLSDKPVTEGTDRYIAWVNQSITHEQIYHDLFIESPLPHPSVMFRKSAVDALGAYRDFDGPEDYDLWLRMAEQGMRFHKIPETLLKWRFHESNLTKTDSRYRKNAFLERKIVHILEALANGTLTAKDHFRICGTSKAGRALHRALKAAGWHVEAYIDVAAKNMGKNCQGIPVLPTSAIDTDQGRFFYFCTVKRWDSWDKLRELFGNYGKTEGANFLIL